MQHKVSDEIVEIIHQLETLVGREHVAEEYVRFRIALLKAQATAYGALTQQVPAESGEVERTEPKAALPIIAPSEVTFDGVIAKKLLDSAATALPGRDGSGADLTHLTAAAAEDSDLLVRLAYTAVFDPDTTFLAAVSDRLRIELAALLFFGRALAAPFVTIAVARHMSRAESLPDVQGWCPWCGASAGLATLSRDEGKRVLCCSLCGNSWHFSRAKCPFCGNQDELGALSLDDDCPHSVATCDACRGYIKTVDERKLPEQNAVFPVVETTAALYFDLLAEQAGYSRGLPYVALR